MKKLNLLFLIFTNIIFIQQVLADNHEKKIKALEEDIIELKLNHMDKKTLDISGEFNNLFHYYNYESNESDIERDVSSYFVSDFKVNIDKKDKSTIKFYSTLGASYFWNNNFQRSAVVTDNGQSVLKSAYPFVEKAYFDYFLFKKNFSFSIGRLPTQYGPPLHISSNLSRQGTYPALLYSVPLDGIGLTLNLGNLFASSKRYILRAIVSPFYNRSSLSSPDEVGKNGSFNGAETTDGSALHINFETSADSSIGKYNFILQGFYAKLGRPKSVQDVRGVLEDNLPAGTVDNNIYEIGSDDKNLSVMKSVIAYFELNDVFKTKFDFYTSFKKSWFKKRGNLDAVITEDNMGSALGAAGTTYDIGGFIYNDDANGESIFIGTRYKFSPKFNVGLEYIRQTHGNTPTSIRSINFFDFYNILGYGYHAYFNWLLEKDLRMGVGYTYNAAESEFETFRYGSTGSTTQSSYVSLRYSF